MTLPTEMETAERQLLLWRDLLLTAILMLASVYFPLWLMARGLSVMLDWRWGFFVGWLVVAYAARRVFYSVECGRVLLRAVVLLPLGLALDQLCSLLWWWFDVASVSYLPLFSLALPIGWAGRAWYRESRNAVGSAPVFAFIGGSIRGIGIAPLLAVLAFQPWTMGFGPQERGHPKSALVQSKSFEVISFLAEGLNIYRIDEAVFARHLVADTHYFYDQKLMDAVPSSATVAQVMKQVIPLFDPWSHLATLDALKLYSRSEEVGTGMLDFKPAGTGYVMMRIAEESLAAEQGLRRGDVLLKIDGIPATEYSRSARPAGKSTRPRVFEVKRTDGSVESLAIPIGVFQEDLVGKVRIHQAGSRVIGYLPFHGFSSKANAELYEAMRQMKVAKVDEVVLDLRYNGGGEVDMVGRLAGMLAPKAALGKRALVTRTSWRVGGEEREVPISTTENRPVDDPKRLTVIISERTCSASEALISVLKPYMEVVTVGATSCGKPVGYRPRVYREKAYWVVSFAVRNARDEGSYYSGLPPTCAAVDDHRYGLGNVRETSLRVALEYIDSGTCMDGRSENSL